MTYFTSGLKFGGPVTRSAYSKVVCALFYVLSNEPKLRWAIGSDILENAILNNQILVTLGATSLGAAIAEKAVKENVKNKTMKKFGITVSAAFLAATLISEKMYDQIAVVLKESQTAFKGQRMFYLSQAKSKEQVEGVLRSAGEKRESLGKAYLFEILGKTNAHHYEN
jgi:hypothetical protein